MTDLPPNAQTVFIDRNSGGRSFRDALTEAGINVVLHDEHFPHIPGKPVPDQEWLVAIGNLGWLIVTGDKRTVKESLFIRSIPESNAYVFILDDLNGSSPAKRAEIIIEAYPKMLGLISAQPPPAIWIFSKGRIKPIQWREILKRTLKRGM